MLDRCESTGRVYWTPAPHDRVKLYREARLIDGSPVIVWFCIHNPQRQWVDVYGLAATLRRDEAERLAQMYGATVFDPEAPRTKAPEWAM